MTFLNAKHISCIKWTSAGVKQNELGVLEDICSLKINVYGMREVTQSDRFPRGIKLSVLRNSNLSEQPNGVCNLLRIQDHIMLITDLERAIGYYICSLCQMRVGSRQNFRKHLQACTKTSKLPGGVKEVYHSGELYSPGQGIFDELEEKLNFKFENETKRIGYLITFDCETNFNDLKEPERRGNCTETVSLLECFLIGCCSNIPGFLESKLFWLDQDPIIMMQDFVNHLEMMSIKQAELLRQQLQPVYRRLDVCYAMAEHNGNEYGCRELKRLRGRLNNFVEVVCVLGYNMGRFDSRYRYSPGFAFKPPPPP